jgi:catechol-2,3-dioxygenase
MDNSTPVRLGHVAIAVRGPRSVATFYRDLLDLEIDPCASTPLTGDAVLLSGDPAQEDHELALLSNRRAEHIAFRVSGVRQLKTRQLKTLYTRAWQRGLEIPHALDSSAAVGFFLRDPDGNAVEIYIARAAPGRSRPPLTDRQEIDRLILYA